VRAGAFFSFFFSGVSETSGLKGSGERVEEAEEHQAASPLPLFLQAAGERISGLEEAASAAEARHESELTAARAQVRGVAGRGMF
jgi:hypothetical protein